MVKTKKEQDALICGVAISVAELCDQGEATLAVRVCRSIGFTWEDFKQAGVKPFVLEKIKARLSFDDMCKIGAQLWINAKSRNAEADQPDPS